MFAGLFEALAELAEQDSGRVTSGGGAGLQSLLAAEYERSADEAITETLKLMTRYDVLDLDKKALREELEAEIEKDGPRSNRARTLAAKLEKVEQKLAALRKQEAEILDLGLKREKL